jgi:hypothetical protein
VRRNGGGFRMRPQSYRRFTTLICGYATAHNPAPRPPARGLQHWRSECALLDTRTRESAGDRIVGAEPEPEPEPDSACTVLGTRLARGRPYTRMDEGDDPR